jgi:hypothetical protein
MTTPQTAAQAARKALANSQPSSASTPPRPTFSTTPQAAQFWRQMAQIYGRRWTSTHGEAPTELWSMGVSGLSPEQLSMGLAECVRCGEPWPPSLPEFLAWCRPRSRENAAMYRCVPQLPAPVSDKETARTELAKLRRVLA